MRRIEITKVDGQGYSIMVDGLFNDGLTPDETLGVVASALFGSGKPLYVRDPVHVAPFCHDNIAMLRTS